MLCEIGTISSLNKHNMQCSIQDEWSLCFLLQFISTLSVETDISLAMYSIG